jgi:uncharacterized RDD family membrane protein YckC
MSQADLYAPPTASVAGATPAELSAKANGEVVIAGIGQRIGATLIDWIILLPFIALDAWCSGLSRSAGVAMNAFYLVLILIVQIGMVRVYGGSPGKLMLGLRVTLADGAPVTWKAAFARYSVFWLASLALGVGQSMAILSMQDDAFLAQNYLERTVTLSAHAPAWSAPLNYALYAWAFACFVSLLATKRRRTLGDFQAGTVVVHPL